MYTGNLQSIEVESYTATESGFVQLLEDAADAAFPFRQLPNGTFLPDGWDSAEADGSSTQPSYRDGQEKLTRGAVKAFYARGADNVVLEGPTGVGKSGCNTAIGKVASFLARRRKEIQDHWNVIVPIEGYGRSFMTSPQKALRNQLAEDPDLKDSMEMLKSRQDYTCGETGQSCEDCSINKSSEESCMEMGGCTYWKQKETCFDADIATLTFSMLIVDSYMPSHIDPFGMGTSLPAYGDIDGGPSGQQISFEDRELLMVDECQSLEGQVASLHAGWSLSPYAVPPEEVFQDAGDRLSWDAERYDDVEDIVADVAHRAREYVQKYEDFEEAEQSLKQCETFLRKLEFTLDSLADDEPWVVEVDEVNDPRDDEDTTKKLTVKPVYVSSFLSSKVWSRARKRLLTSATIPFRGNIDKWADRIGLEGDTVFLSVESPFPREHRLIHTNTTVGKMSGDGEDKNWSDAMNMIRIIMGKHPGEKGIVHTVSYKRAEKIRDSLGRDVVFMDDPDRDTSECIDAWQASDKPLFASPAATEGVDLHGGRGRYNILVKAPFAYMGDSRTSYLVNELKQWDWYFQEASIDLQQAFGRVVRGPEPEEAASTYLIDAKVEEVLNRTDVPEWLMAAVTDEKPDHWDAPEAAPWRSA